MRIEKPYHEGPLRAVKALRKSYGFGTKRDVRHRCNCPVCGAKLVNLYLVDDTWKCSKCKEKENVED